MVPVDKTNRTIKAILDKSVGTEWMRAPKGREVFVEEVDPSWTYSGDFTKAILFLVAPDGSRRDAREEAQQWQAQFVHPTDRLALIVGRTAKPPNKRSVVIYVPQLDHAQMDVARDALLIGDKQLIATALEPFGLYAGLVRAILERQVRSFAKAAHPKKSTKQIRREVDDFLRSQGRL
jgi:hypothetical protein